MQEGVNFFYQLWNIQNIARDVAQEFSVSKVSAALILNNAVTLYKIKEDSF